MAHEDGQVSEESAETTAEVESVDEDSTGWIQKVRAKRKEQKEIEDELWQETGFQRILGGFWHNYIFMLFIMIFGMVMMGLIFPNYILPYPEAMGFKSVVSSLFSLLFTIFDVGIGSAVTRFVAEYVGRGEMKKGMEYLRFFIWFQMITGLLQVTIVAFWALRFATETTTFAPLVWFFIINSLVQYPGMLGIYRSALQAFQRYDKANIVSFVQMVFLESTTQIIFIFVGRWWGINTPYMGELMGATMGYIIGLYIDDFLAMVLAAKYFSDVLKPYGISIWDTFVPRFSKKVIKKALLFGSKNMAQGIFYQVSMLWITGVTMIWLPNYSTIIGLFSIADGLARLIIQDLPTKAAIAESYNSGKLRLTDYIIQSQFKWYGILTFFLTLEIGMLIPPVLGDIAANYASAAWMIPYLLISRFFIPPIHFSDSVQQGCDKPEYAAYSLAVQMVTRMITFTLLLNPGMIPSLIPGYNYTIAYLMADLPPIIAKNIFAWMLIDRKLVKIRVNIWQTFVAPFLAILPLIPINLGLLWLFNTYSTNQFIAIIMGLIFIVFLLFGAPTFIVFPMLGLVGGWDERSIEHLKNAALISGPSKPFVMTMYRISKWCWDRSPLKKIGKKYKIPYEDADREAIELIQKRAANLKEKKAEVSKVL